MTLVWEVTLLLMTDLRAADAISHGLLWVLRYLLIKLACAACKRFWAMLCIVSRKYTLLC